MMDSRSHIVRIKHMVCPRCITVVKQILTELQLPFSDVQLGIATLRQPPNAPTELKAKLEEHGFEIITNQAEYLTEKVKLILRRLVEEPESHGWELTVSSILTSEIPFSYEDISRKFSRTTGLTISQYLTGLRIEKSKELLRDGELTVRQIATAQGYRTTQHFYRQFLKTAGMSVKDFRASSSGLQQRFR